MEARVRSEIQALVHDENWARARMKLAASVAPDDVEYLALLAEVESGEGSTDRAVEHYRKILELKPGNRAALYNLALALSDLEQHDHAVESLETLVELEGESASLLNDLAGEYHSAGHYVPALLAGARAESLATNEDERCTARLHAAHALADMGRGNEAATRLHAMLAACTDACELRDDATALRDELGKKKSP